MSHLFSVALLLQVLLILLLLLYILAALVSVLTQIESDIPNRFLFGMPLVVQEYLDYLYAGFGE